MGPKQSICNWGDKPAETTEGRKGKKEKEQKNSEKETEKEKEEVKPEILVAAPPPAVNIWQQPEGGTGSKGKVQPICTSRLTGPGSTKLK